MNEIRAGFRVVGAHGRPLWWALFCNGYVAFDAQYRTGANPHVGLYDHNMLQTNNAKSNIVYIVDLCSITFKYINAFADR